MSHPSKSVNADPLELQKFERAADKWWDLEGEFGALHKINPLRSDFIESLSSDSENSSLENKSLLDIGCGGGILSEEMARRGARVCGIDLGEAPTAVAKSHAKEAQLDIEYRIISAEDAALEVKEGKREAFDVVTCMEMLEHVPNPASVVNAASQLCKPGGSVFFGTINRTPKAYMLMVLGAEYILKMVPRGTHDYAKFIQPAELNRWMRSAQLELLQSSGIVYNPFSKRFRLDPNDLDVNYLLHSKKH